MSEPVPPITEDDIANYLANTPDFFERHAQVLAGAQLTSPHGNRAVSLQERQAEMLRDKIRALEHRLMDMIRHGSDNLVIADRLHRWSTVVLGAKVARDLPGLIEAELAAQFMVPQVAIRVWGVNEIHLDEAFAQGASEDARALASSLTAPYCGVNSGFEVAHWLPDPKAALSLALLPLRAGALSGGESAFGMLVLASPDPQRYQAGMGTEFLVRIAELASAALGRLR